MINLTQILETLSTYGFPVGLPAVVTIVVFFFYIRNPSIFERHLAKLFSLFGRFCRFVLRHLQWAGGYFRRKSISTNIETYVNSAMRTLKNESLMLDPRGVKVEFIRPGHAESARIDEEDQVVLVLHPQNAGINLAIAVWRFSQLGPIRDGAEYLDPPVKLATDLNLTRRVLFGKDRTKRDAYYHFKQYILSDCLANEEVDKWYGKLRAIDSNGFFTRVYLNEVAELCESLANSGVSDECIPKEVRTFIDFLFAIHERKKGQHTELRFVEPWIGIQIILVGKAEKLAQREIWRYLDVIEDSIISGAVKSIYVAAFDNPDSKVHHPRTDPIATAQQVADAAEKRWKTVRRASRKDVLFRGVIHNEPKVIICIPLRVTQSRT